MLKHTPHKVSRPFHLLCVGATLALLAGCGPKKRAGEPDITTIPVSGKVTVDSAPMVFGFVEYHPDAAKGNTGTLKPRGLLSEDGTYKLQTSGKEGAPAGWYKVTVLDRSPTGTPPENNPKPNPAYAAVQTTTLSIQVLDNAPPGSYDLKLAK